MLPEWPERLGGLASSSPMVLSLGLLAVGVLFLLFGWHVYRVSTVTIGVLMGGAMGAGVAYLVGIPALILAIPLGIVVGLLTPRMEKFGAFLAGGLCGAMPLLMSGQALGSGWGIYVAAAFGFVLAGIVAVFVWRPTVIIGLALAGAYFIANAVSLGGDVFDVGIRRLMTQHPYITGGAIGLLTLVGALFQSRKEKGNGKTSRN